jgi:hypothetical protein
MVIRQNLLTACIAAVGITLCANSSFSQSAAEQKISEINWEHATHDAEQSSSIAPALNEFRTNNSAELASIKLPVLMPNTTAVDASPRLRGQGSSYVIAYTLPNAKLSILGTSGFLTRPDDKVLSQSGQAPTRIFDRSDDSSDLSFLKYGASYVLRLSCTTSEDERCVNETFLNGIADSLLVVGGRK